jgi:hypothetical protein
MHAFLPKIEGLGNSRDSGKVAVVAHSMFFRYHTTCEHYWQHEFTEKAQPSADQFVTLGNCEAHPDMHFKF